MPRAVRPRQARACPDAAFVLTSLTETFRLFGSELNDRAALGTGKAVIAAVTRT